MCGARVARLRAGMSCYIICRVISVRLIYLMVIRLIFIGISCLYSAFPYSPISVQIFSFTAIIQYSAKLFCITVYYSLYSL